MPLKSVVSKILPVFVFVVFNYILYNFDVPVFAAGNSYYVSTTGSDTNNGTSLTTPYKTIAKAITSASAGDTIYVRAGTYPAFSVTKSGSAGNYLTISGYGSEKPIITGSSQQIVLTSVSYVRISGFEVIGATASWGGGIYVDRSNYNIIENNIVHDNTGSNTSGILVSAGSYNKILNNEVYNNYLNGIQIISHSSTQSVGNEISNNKSYNNTLSGGNSDGIKLEGLNTKNNLISNNLTYGNADDGVDTWNSSNNQVVGNISHSHRGGGDGNGFKLGGLGATTGYNKVVQNISYNNKNHGFDSNGSGGNQYYHNVAYANSGFGFEDGYKDSGCTGSGCNSIYINNIGYNNVRGNFSAGDFTYVSRNNLWFSDGGSAKVFYRYTQYSTLSSFYQATSNRLDNPTVSVQLNPSFVNAAGYNFSLNSNSPAIDKGDSTNPGQIIAVGIPDIGAFEYGDVVVTPTPVATPAATTSPVAATATPSGQLGSVTHQQTVFGSALNYPKSVISGEILGASNSLYLVSISTKRNTAVTSVSGLGLNWQLAKSQCGARAQTRTEVWYAVGSPATNGAVTANFTTAPEEAVISVSRYSGADQSNPIGNLLGKNSNGLDGSCSGGTDASSYSANLTTTTSSSLIYSAVGIRQNSHTSGANYTERSEVKSSNGGSTAGVATQDRTVDLTTALVNGTMSANVDYSLVALEIKPSAASSEPTPVVKSGDANGDNTVNEIDYSQFWKPNYLKLNCGGVTCGDFDKSGKVDGVDYVVWLNNYGK